jgi:hypothetical protein
MTSIILIGMLHPDRLRMGLHHDFTSGVDAAAVIAMLKKSSDMEKAEGNKPETQAKVKERGP